MNKMLDLMITVEDDLSSISVEVYDPESGVRNSVVNSFSPDEHPEFDSDVGALLYSWATLMADRIEEEKKNGN